MFLTGPVVPPSIATLCSAVADTVWPLHDDTVLLQPHSCNSRTAALLPDPNRSVTVLKIEQLAFMQNTKLNKIKWKSAVCNINIKIKIECRFFNNDQFLSGTVSMWMMQWCGFFATPHYSVNIFRQIASKFTAHIKYAVPQQVNWPCPGFEFPMLPLAK